MSSVTHLKHESVEANRARLQDSFDRTHSQKSRNRAGQFATPYPLAKGIVALALEELRPKQSIRFLDPAVGTGVFFSALSALVESYKVDSARGIEIDSEVISIARNVWAGFPLQVEKGDFTELFPTPDKRANLIVCNPPYVRHHHILTEKKEKLRERIEQELGIRVNGLAGLYCYFVLLAHRWLDEQGVGAWLIPSEFMDVNYGEVIRGYLTSQVSLSQVHWSDPARSEFAEALVTSSIVLFKKQPANEQHLVKLSYGGTPCHPKTVRSVSVRELRTNSKWTGLINGRKTPTSRSAAAQITLGELFTVRRGIATGANNFFVLPKREALERRLPERFLTPILPSPRFISSNVIDADEHGWPLIPEIYCLVNCNLPEVVVAHRHPELFKYFETGKALGLPKRYLLASRLPWYRQEVRPPAPIVCTYMGRSDNRGRPTFRFIRNLSSAIATNVYLLLYPVPAIAALIKRNQEFLNVLSESLVELGQADLISNGRTYGGGLHKIEPSELKNFPLRDKHLIGQLEEARLLGSKNELLEFSIA